jgi:hypothetical protein
MSKEKRSLIPPPQLRLNKSQKRKGILFQFLSNMPLFFSPTPFIIMLNHIVVIASEIATNIRDAAPRRVGLLLTS